jgi:hypothetical protein
MLGRKCCIATASIRDFLHFLMVTRENLYHKVRAVGGGEAGKSKGKSAPNSPESSTYKEPSQIKLIMNTAKMDEG